MSESFEESGEFDMQTNYLDFKKLEKDMEAINKLAKEVIDSINGMLPETADKLDTLKTVLPTIAYIIIQVCLKYKLDVYTFISYIASNIRLAYKMLDIMSSTSKHLMN